MSEHRRASDRWITPGVVGVFILAGTVIVLAILAAVTYLTARGYDPEPIVQLVGTLVAAAAASGNFLLQLIGRKTQTRIERHTGLLPAKVDEVATKVEEALWVDVNGTQQLPPVPPPVRERLTAPHPFSSTRAGGDPGGDGEI